MYIGDDRFIYSRREEIENLRKDFVIRGYFRGSSERLRGTHYARCENTAHRNIIGHPENTFVFVKEISAFLSMASSPSPELPQGDRMGASWMDVERSRTFIVEYVKEERRYITDMHTCKAKYGNKSLN